MFSPHERVGLNNESSLPREKKPWVLSQQRTPRVAFYNPFSTWHGKKNPNKLETHISPHCACSTVELVRTCDNLAFLCSHVNKHSLPVACWDLHNPPRICLPAPRELHLAKLLTVSVGGWFTKEEGGFWRLLHFEVTVRVAWPLQVPQQGWSWLDLSGMPGKAWSVPASPALLPLRPRWRGKPGSHCNWPGS